MLGKRTHQMVGRLSEILVSGNRILDVATSPRSPLDYKIQSPRGLKNYDLGGVGLGIVAALEKCNTDGGHEVLAKYAICSPNLNRSHPIPVNSVKICEKFKEMEMESLENYTYVTSCGPNKSFTKVYYDGVEQTKNGYYTTGFDTGTDDIDNFGVIPMSKEFQSRFVEDVSEYPTSHFLSSCHLCRKKLHGKDIYMYRGEKAFCSVECRSRQIMIDERKEQCRSEVKRSADVSSSPYARSPNFSTGIFAI